MAEPLKLTDEVIESVRRAVATTDLTGLHARAVANAIRDLRDAAMAVVEAERDGIWIVVERRIGDLEELLPEVRLADRNTVMGDGRGDRERHAEDVGRRAEPRSPARAPGQGLRQVARDTFVALLVLAAAAVGGCAVAYLGALIGEVLRG